MKELNPKQLEDDLVKMYQAREKHYRVKKRTPEEKLRKMVRESLAVERMERT